MMVFVVWSGTISSSSSCQVVLASALWIGITIASTEHNAFWTVYTIVGWDVSSSLTQLLYHGHVSHLARAASMWRRDWLCVIVVTRDTLYRMKTKGAQLCCYRGCPSSVSSRRTSLLTRPVVAKHDVIRGRETRSWYGNCSSQLYETCVTQFYKRETASKDKIETTNWIN